MGVQADRGRLPDYQRGKGGSKSLPGTCLLTCGDRVLLRFAGVGSQPRDQAVADVVGALCYALLRSFEAAARGVTQAPEVSLAEQQARFAAEDLERFRALREHLAALTDDPERAMAAFRAPVDAFYEHAQPSSWLETQVFSFVGDSVTTDFAELLAPALDPRTGEAVREALTGRTARQATALEQIGQAMEREHEAARSAIARYAGTIVGEALSRLREALLANDALEVVLGAGAVKDVVLEVLGRHRERLARLAIDPIDD